jgi:hypothetical protein
VYLVPVRDSSIEAYHELKEEGKLTPRQSQAFNALKEYAEAEDTDRWPTKVELYEWAQANLDNEEFPVSRLGNFKPRITELTPGYEGTDFALVEYLDEKREQDSSTTDRSAHPVKILSYQSTLSSEKEAAELKETGSESSPETGSDRPGSDIEIPYSVNGGSEVRMANPEEAIAQTDDLEGVEEMLEQKDLLEEYQEDIEAVREDREDSGSDDGDEVAVDDEDLVEVDGEQYVLDPREDPDVDVEEQSEVDESVESENVDESDSSESTEDDGSGDSEQQKILMKDGKPVG